MSEGFQPETLPPQEGELWKGVYLIFPETGCGIPGGQAWVGDGRAHWPISQGVCCPRFPRWLSGKESIYQGRRRGLDLWVGKIPCNPPQCSCLEMDYSPRGRKEPDTTE